MVSHKVSFFCSCGISFDGHMEFFLFNFLVKMIVMLGWFLEKVSFYSWMSVSLHPSSFSCSFSWFPAIHHSEKSRLREALARPVSALACMALTFTFPLLSPIHFPLPFLPPFTLILPLSRISVFHSSFSLANKSFVLQGAASCIV